MSASELVQNMTFRQFKNIQHDFKLLWHRCSSLEAQGKPITTVLSPEIYRGVINTIHAVRSAIRHGEHKEAGILYGIAAAMYGLVRLEEAEKLEKQLGKAIGLSRRGREGGSATSQNTSDKAGLVGPRKQFGLEDLVSFLTEQGITCATQENNGLVMAIFGGDEASPVHIVACVDAEHSALCIKLRLAISVPSEKSSAMAHAVVLANHGMVLGYIEYNMKNGELNYVIGMPTDGAWISDSQLDHCLGLGFSIVRRYQPAFCAIAFNDADPVQAIEECER